MEITQIWKQMRVQKKCVIISTFIFGIIAHGPMMFNKFSKFDDIRYLFTGGATFSSGRWMLYLAEKIKNLLFGDSIYGLPLPNIVFSLICIAAVLCIIIDLFKIESPNLCILLSGIFVTIPVVTCMYGFMFTAQFFSFAILCAVLGSFLVLTKDKWYWILIGILLMTCSVGIYQAYIPLMICIFLFGLIKRFAEAESGKDRIRGLIRAGIILLSCAAFLLLNNTILNFFLRINNISLSGYKGIGLASKIPLTDYFRRAVFAYREFFLPQRDTFYDTFPGASRILYILSLAPAVFFFAVFLYSASKRSKINALIVFLLGLMVPLAVNFIFVMVDETYCYVMMVYGYAMYFVFLIWLFEQIKDALDLRLRKISKMTVTVLLCLIVAVFGRFDDVCYMRLEMVQAQTARFYTSLITRMQSTPGYRVSMKVAYIGQPQILDYDTTVPEIPELNYIHVSPYFGFRESILTESWREFMEQWGLFKAWETDPSEFEDLPEVQKMPSYPEDGSIRVINNTLVVKFLAPADDPQQGPSE